MYICRVFFFIISNPCHYVDIVLSVDYVLFRVFMCVFVLLESVIAKKIIDVHVFVVFFQYQIDFYKANCALHEFFLNV